MQGLRARGGAQSSRQEGGRDPSEGAGSSREHVDQTIPPARPEARPAAGGRHSRLDRRKSSRRRGLRSRGGEPAHPVTLKQSVPCLPLPRALAAAPGCSRSAWPAAGAALTRRVKPLSGPAGALAWRSGGHAYIPGPATWWRSKEPRTRQALGPCWGGFPGTSTWPDRPCSLHGIRGHSGLRTREGRSLFFFFFLILAHFIIYFFS